MNAVLLVVSVGVEYPALLSAVDCVGIVGFILRLKAQVFSSILYNYRHLEGTDHDPESIAQAVRPRKGDEADGRPN